VRPGRRRYFFDRELCALPSKRQGIFFAKKPEVENLREKARIMDATAMKRAIQRIAHEIIEKNKGTSNIVMIGIQRRGVPIANMLAEHIGEVENTAIPTGRLDITFYRDDLSLLAEHPVINGTDIPFNITDKDVILVDDVLFTGRTTRAAMEAIMEVGRAKTVQLAVLIDRGHRELPIGADYVGKLLSTSRNEQVSVNVKEVDGDSKVEIFVEANE
jgi:pyrimidine operon attenuation protein/uracil phosphoribosyltransferase